jgi:galactose mutarotase-like enzyme
MQYQLNNGSISVEIASHGAELKSLKDKAGREYMWCADPAFWGRTSPVLFPIVGKLNGGKYIWQGKEYEMGGHGFARDSEFVMTAQTETEIWFALCDSDETRAMYPFAFRLEIGYRLRDNSVEVLWRVHNTGEETMYFSIGGHPAFNTPLEGKGCQTDCFLEFDRKDSMLKTGFDENGRIIDKRVLVTLENGRLAVHENSFKYDAIILEDHQIKHVALCQPDGSRYVSVDFDMPAVGVWSPRPDAPFICLEPWCGLADKRDFCGRFEERPYTNRLAAGETFEQGYTITVE